MDRPEWGPRGTVQYNRYMAWYMKERRKTDVGREEYRKTDHSRNKEFRQWLATLKRQPCEGCGGSFPSYVMQFHHKNPGEKYKNVSQMTHSSREAVLREIEKCDLLCANCHAMAEFGAE